MAKSKKGADKELPGIMEDVAKHPDVTRAAKRTKQLRAEWQELGTRVAKSKDALIACMRKHKLTSYVTDGLRIELVDGKESVKITEISTESEA